MKTNSLANWLLEDNLVEAQKYITESSEEKTEKESGKEEKGEKEEKEELEVDVKKLIKLIAKLDKYAEKLEDETLEKLVGEFEKLAGIEKEEDELSEARRMDKEISQKGSTGKSISGEEMTKKDVDVRAKVYNAKDGAVELSPSRGRSSVIDIYKDVKKKLESLKEKPDNKNITSVMGAYNKTTANLIKSFVDYLESKLVKAGFHKDILSTINEWIDDERVEELTLGGLKKKLKDEFGEDDSDLIYSELKSSEIFESLRSAGKIIRTFKTYNKISNQLSDIRKIENQLKNSIRMLDNAVSNII